MPRLHNTGKLMGVLAGFLHRYGRKDLARAVAKLAERYREHPD